MSTKQRLEEIKHHKGMGAFLRLKNGLNVRVKILDVRVPYGHVRYTVSPVDGEGTAVVDGEYITVIETNDEQISL